LAHFRERRRLGAGGRTDEAVALSGWQTPEPKPQRPRSWASLGCGLLSLLALLPVSWIAIQALSIPADHDYMDINKTGGLLFLLLAVFLAAASALLFRQARRDYLAVDPSNQHADAVEHVTNREPDRRPDLGGQRALCGRCGQLLDTSWRYRCMRCWADYEDYPPKPLE
jgi:hypothetical protein